MNLIQLKNNFRYSDKTKEFSIVLEYEQYLKYYKEVKLILESFYAQTEKKINLIMISKNRIDRKVTNRLSVGINIDLAYYENYKENADLDFVFKKRSVFLDLAYCIVPTHDYLARRLYSNWYGCVLITRNAKAAKLVAHPLASYFYNFNSYDSNLDISSVTESLLDAYAMYTTQPFKWIGRLGASRSIARDFTLDKLLKIIINYKPYV